MINHMMDEADFYRGDVPEPPTIQVFNGSGELVGEIPEWFAHGWDYEMKSWPAFYSKMITGEKKHDMRDKRDRDYKVGDRALLREYDPFGGGYTGRYAIFKITYITSNDTPCAMSSSALDRNHCILSMELVIIGETHLPETVQ